jgi:NADPH-dependent F420 reductase
VIAILGGTGQQGRGIARRLARAGDAIVVGSRDPARAAAAVAEWPESAHGAVSGADYGTAIASADTVILAVPFEAAGPLLEEHRDRFRAGSVLVDVMVPLSFGGGKVTLLDVAEGSAAEFVRARVPAHVRVAAAFKTLPAHLLNDVDRPLECDELVCGDSEEARAAAVALVERMDGLRAVDLGPLARARSLEHLTLVAVAINRRRKIHDARFRIVGI